MSDNAHRIAEEARRRWGHRERGGYPERCGYLEAVLEVMDIHDLTPRAFIEQYLEHAGGGHDRDRADAAPVAAPVVRGVGGRAGAAGAGHLDGQRRVPQAMAQSGVTDLGWLAAVTPEPADPTEAEREIAWLTDDAETESLIEIERRSHAAGQIWDDIDGVWR